jgi:hypothetical protein
VCLAICDAVTGDRLECRFPGLEVRVITRPAIRDFSRNINSTGTDLVGAVTAVFPATAIMASMIRMTCQTDSIIKVYHDVPRQRVSGKSIRHPEMSSRDYILPILEVGLEIVSY